MKNIKKSFFIIILLMLTLSISACSGKENGEKAQDRGEKAKIEYIVVEDSEITDLYQLQKEIEQKVQVFVLQEMEKSKYLDLGQMDETDYIKIIRESIIDETAGNVILAEGAKAATNAMTENKSSNEIAAEVSRAINSGAEKYVKGKIKEYVLKDTPKIFGMNIVDASQWVNDFLNVDDIPYGLLEAVAKLQAKDIEVILAIAGQDNYTYGDLDCLLATYLAVSKRQNELIMAGAEVEELKEADVLRELVGEWNRTHTTLEKLVVLSEGNYEKVNEITTIEDDGLQNIKLNSIPVNYDVEAYRESQKASKQAGNILQKAVDIFSPDDILGNTFSNMMGSLISDDQEKLQESVQDNRIELYEYLEEMLRKAQYQLCVAKSIYDGEYDVINSGDERIYAVGVDQLIAAKNDYISALNRYQYVLSVAQIIYENTLSIKEDEFIGEIESEIKSISAYTTINGDDGYSEDEKVEIYCDALGRYVDYLDYSLVNALSDTTFFLSKSVTAYGVGNFLVYSKGEDKTPIIFSEEQTNRNRGEKRYLWVYDAEGNPIYIYSAWGTAYIINGEIVRFDWNNEVNKHDEYVDKLLDNSFRILEDYQNGVLSQTYEKYAL